MRKVKIDFFCIKTKVSYKAGDDYKGKRTDLNHVLEPEPIERFIKKETKKPEKKEDKQHPKTRKGAIQTKKKK